MTDQIGQGDRKNDPDTIADPASQPASFFSPTSRKSKEIKTKK